MTRYGIVIDINRCVGCYNCFLTCRDEYAGNDYPGYSAAQPMSGMNWMKVIELERGQYPQVKVDYIPIMCSTATTPTASSWHQTGAVYRRADGIVIIDPVKAKGQKEIVKPARTAASSGTKKPRWPRSAPCAPICWTKARPEPRCVESCPSGRVRLRRPGRPEQRGRHRWWPIGQDRGHASGVRPWTRRSRTSGLPKKFVAGTVIYGDIDEVAKDVGRSPSTGDGTT